MCFTFFHFTSCFRDVISFSMEMQRSIDMFFKTSFYYNLCEKKFPANGIFENYTFRIFLLVIMKTQAKQSNKGKKFI